MIEFENYNKTMRVPFVVYVEFESIIKPINTCTPNPNESYTKQYQRHTTSSFCYYIKCFDESEYKSKPVTFTASCEKDDVAQIFVNRLEEDIKKIYKDYLRFTKNMIFTNEDKENFNNAKVCHICEKELEKDKKLSEEKLNCIPNNEEKYISFSKELKVGEFTNKECKNVEVKLPLRLVDSYRFMASSLDSLSKNLTKEQFKNIRKYFSGSKLGLLLRKGIYPYEWVDFISKLNETQLPSKESFYSRLNNEGISDEDYLHAQTVWKEFHCKNFRDYHNLYNVSDVLLLADVFESFRDVCMKNYKLDPDRYYTSPGLAWDEALKKTKIELKLLSDYDMILMIKQGIRGEIIMISKRLGTANNKYMETYDESKESTYIRYLDANNLYEWAMSKPHPTHNFKWMNDEELKNWKSISCILEVDLEYPENLHDAHNGYPLSSERLKIDKVEKLVPNLNHKKNYIIHYENLKLYERLGMKLSKIHRGIKFKDSAWLSKYFEINTNLRAKATNNFEKEFFKLMNNSVFGKTMENIENRVDVRLVTER
ncbi:uncharacterized protein LOC136085805 [Hydra vulgaris]|uniref:uncharacterized protein LOC136085805 n=1 Tax=Hydra vulgaris TaxID=6087 RepID=UPI0032EA22B5